MDELNDLKAIDLNLLLVFRAVDETRHVTKAAKLLGTSQPALSHALRRLRNAFSDPLFVKAPAGMVLTPLAERIAPSIRENLRRLNLEVFRRGPFRLGALTRTFRIRTTDLVECLLMPSLLDAFMNQAPKAQVVVQAVGLGLPKTELESGATDLAIAGFFGELPDGYYQQRLLTDEFRCAVRVDHPRLRRSKTLSLDAFCEEKHLLISPGGDLSGAVDLALRRVKRKRNLIGGLSGFMVSGWVASKSDCVLTAPKRLLSKFEELSLLRTFRPPLALPDIKIAQVWHERNHSDAGHRWLREQVQAALKQ